MKGIKLRGHVPAGQYQVEKYLLYACALGELDLMTKAIKRQQHPRSVKLSKVGESFLLHGAASHDMWTQFLHLVHIGYQFSSDILEAAILHALEKKELLFVHSVLLSVGGIENIPVQPWEILRAFVQDACLFGSAQKILSQLPSSANVRKIKKIRKILKKTCVSPQHQSKKLLLLKALKAKRKELEKSGSVSCDFLDKRYGSTEFLDVRRMSF